MPQPKRLVVLVSGEGSLLQHLIDAASGARDAPDLGARIVAVGADRQGTRALGRAEVRKTFVVQGNTVGGAMVIDGRLLRSARARLVRDGRVVWEGKIASLRRFKDDAREVQAGYECGIGLENFNDLKLGDMIEDFEMEAVLRKLGTPKAEPMRGTGAPIEKQLQT